jgi:chemotaxis signal transduction protein
MSGGMKKTAHDETTTRSTGAARSHDAPRRRLFVMRSGARLFAVYADEVEATSENLTPTPLPFAPPPVRGLVSRRGRILTLIDPLPLLPAATLDGAATTAAAAQPPAPHATQTTAPLVVALKGDEQLALSVEAVEREVELYDAEADVTAAADASGGSLLRRIIPYHAHAVALLDPARLFEAAMQGVERRRRRT